jgi:hypothetical protein
MLIKKLLNKSVIFNFPLKKSATSSSLWNISFIRKCQNDATQREIISLQEMQKKIENIMYEIRIKYTETYLKSYRNSNCFEKVISRLFNEISKKTDLELFDLFSNNFNSWQELEKILITCVNDSNSKKTNTSLDISAENFIDVKLIQVFYEKQSDFFNANIDTENFYYNLIQSYFDHITLTSNDNIKLSQLEAVLSSLITRYDSLLLQSDSNDPKLNDISDRINKTNKLVKNKVPASVFKNFYSAFNILVLEGMLHSKDDHEKAFEILNKEIKNYLNLQNIDKPFPSQLIRSLLISSIVFSNDLIRFEYLINKCVELNDAVYPIYNLWKLNYLTNKILFNKLKNSDRLSDVNLILNSWSKIDYIPNVEIKNEFKSFLHKVFKNKDSDFIFETRIDSQ